MNVVEAYKNVERYLYEYPTIKKVLECNHNIGKERLEKTKQAIDLLEWALTELKHDPFYEIIPKYYFEGMTHETIACDMEVNNTTISRNRHRLVDKMVVMLFPDVIMQGIIDKRKGI